jgi:hypothetical protein
MNFRPYILVTCLVIGTFYAHSQNEQAIADQAEISSKVMKKYLDETSDKSVKIEARLSQKADKALLKLQNLEAKMQKKLKRIDSAKAKEVFGNLKEKYSSLGQRLNQSDKLGQYIPSLDTLSSSLNFLKQDLPLLGDIRETKEKLAKALGNVKALKNQFSKAEDIKAFIKERRQYLREQLSQLGFAKELKRLNKSAYYYSQQLNEYKELLKDHKKAERKTLEILSKTKPFRDFMRRNSQFASLFRPPFNPDDPSSAQSLAGLQTRVQVNTLIQQQVLNGGANGQSQFRQNLQDAQGKLDELKNKITKYGQNSSDDIMPEGFRPNNQKIKSFWQRLEYGTNFQSQRPNSYFPVTSDIGLSIGYKFNEKSILGIGTSYKIGWGQNIRNINITHQGVGLRSFADVKLKGSFWISGGYEMNYRNDSIELKR